MEEWMRQIAGQNGQRLKTLMWLDTEASTR